MNYVWLGIMNATSDVFKAGNFLPILMPFSNGKDSELETYDRFKRSRIKLINVAV